MLLIIFIVVAVLIIMLKFLPEPQQRSTLTAAEKEGIMQAEEVWDFVTAESIRNKSYNGPLPEYDGVFWSNIYPNIYHTKIAGINYQTGIKPFVNTYFDCLIKADPKNEFDEKAIKIIHESGKHIGFIPAEETEAVRNFLNNQLPYKCKGHITESHDYDNNDRTFFIGEINIQKPDNKINK